MVLAKKRAHLDQGGVGGGQGEGKRRERLRERREKGERKERERRRKEREPPSPIRPHVRTTHVVRVRAALPPIGPTPGVG